MGPVSAHYCKTKSPLWSGHTGWPITETVSRAYERLFSSSMWLRTGGSPYAGPAAHMSQRWSSHSKIQGKSHFYLFFTVNTLFMYFFTCSQKYSMTFWKENAAGTAHSSWKKPSAVTWRQPSSVTLCDPSSAPQCDLVGSLAAARTAPSFL